MNGKITGKCDFCTQQIHTAKERMKRDTDSLTEGNKLFNWRWTFFYCLVWCAHFLQCFAISSSHSLCGIVRNRVISNCEQRECFIDFYFILSVFIFFFFFVRSAALNSIVCRMFGLSFCYFLPQSFSLSLVCRFMLFIFLSFNLPDSIALDFSLRLHFPQLLLYTMSGVFFLFGWSFACSHLFFQWYLFLMVHWWFIDGLFSRFYSHNFRSVPLKSQLNTYTEKGKIPVLDFLSTALESVEYERALTRGLVSFASFIFFPSSLPLCVLLFFFFLLKVTNFTTYIYSVAHNKLLLLCVQCACDKVFGLARSKFFFQPDLFFLFSPFFSRLFSLLRTLTWSMGEKSLTKITNQPSNRNNNNNRK